ncbi:Holliday junction DNA helicase RuvA [Mesoplasma florum]|uniref:Holliday junction branch migration protein RuvA n=1 Tax=Mesoplasma florum TaxID=2151 RepID=UPI000D02F941|nr:Holliday junction branch migration protein RuvA [Mesoplasma florum]AVN59039.1 Holliday junction DNA helicase RuvA [Mesoplasma florum]AVN65154.1 Holliday junction DNA helicase RuvA [Mesoplasma florum]
MKDYLVCDINSKDDNYLYVEYQNKGEYFSYLSKDNFKNEKNIKLFIVDHNTEFENVEIVFRSRDERNLFKELVKIKTVGLKTSFYLLNNFSFEEFIKMIEEYDIEKLAKLKGIGNYTAKLIIEELQKHFFKNKITQKKEKIITSLVKLGFSYKTIMKNIANVDNSLTVDEITKIVMEQISYE